MEMFKRSTLSVPKSGLVSGVQSPVSCLVSDFTILSTKVLGEDMARVLYAEPKVAPTSETASSSQPAGSIMAQHHSLGIPSSSSAFKNSPKAMRCLFGPVDDLEAENKANTRRPSSCSDLSPPNMLRRSKSDFGAIIASRKRSEMCEEGHTSNKKQMSHRNQCASSPRSYDEEQTTCLVVPCQKVVEAPGTPKENVEPNPSFGETSPEFAMAFTPIQPLQPAVLPVTPLGAGKRKDRKKMDLGRRKSVTVNGWRPDIFRTHSTGSLPSSPIISAALPPRPPSVNFDLPELCDHDKAAHLSLPIVSDANGLRYICPETVSKLLNGDFKKKFCIIDCRFEYEYEGGHIKDAVNIKSEEEIERIFLRKPEEDTMLVFHCEFSSHRAPKLCTHLRRKDREMHKDTYPELFYPEMYVIKGGYKNFYESFPQHCDPSEYVPMKAKEHKEKLKENFNLMRSSKVKRSWSTGCIGGSNFFRSSSSHETSNEFVVEEIAVKPATEEMNCNTTHTTPTVQHRSHEGLAFAANVPVNSEFKPVPQFQF